MAWHPRFPHGAPRSRTEDRARRPAGRLTYAQAGREASGQRSGRDNTPAGGYTENMTLATASNLYWFFFFGYPQPLAEVGVRAT